MRFSVFILLIMLFVLVGGTTARSGQPPLLYDVRDFGAVGDGRTLNTKAIQAALDAAHAAGGGTVFFPAGVFKSGTIHLKSNTTMHLGTGTTLLGSETLDDYENGLYNYGSRKIFVYARNADHIAIVGGGTIDGNMVLDTPFGPPSVAFEYCDHVLMCDIKIVNSPGTTPAVHYGQYIDLIRVKVLNCLGAGLTTYCCEDVLVDGMVFDQIGDDPICIKNGISGRPQDFVWPKRGIVTQNFIIRNCTVRNTTHPAVKFGTQTFGVFRNVHVSDCTFQSTAAMFTIQMMRPNMENVPERVLENVSFSNIILNNVTRMFEITSMDVEQPVIRNLAIHHIIADNVYLPSMLEGREGAPIQGVSINHVILKHRGDPLAKWLDVRHVEGLRLGNVDVDLGGAVDTALTFEHGRDLDIDRMTIKGLSGNGPAIRLDHVRGVRISNCTAPAVDTFVEARDGTESLVFLHNDLRAAKKPLVAMPSIAANDVYPPARRVVYDDLAVPESIQAGEPLEPTVTLINEGSAGFVRGDVLVNGETKPGTWLWLEEAEERRVKLHPDPIYRPGEYVIAAGRLSQSLRVASSPAKFTYLDGMTAVAPAVAGETTRITVKVRNVGGQRGTETVTLKSNGRVVTTKDVILDPGELREVTIEHRFEDTERHVLTIGDLEPWPFATFTNNEMHCLRVGETIHFNARGRRPNGQLPYCSGDHSALYIRNVEGDFIATVQVVRQGMTSAEAAAGLIVRNEIARAAESSPALAIAYIRPRYGGTPFWRADTDGDGRVDGGFCGYSAYPVWFKIEKRGELFTAYTSLDRRIWHIAQHAGGGDPPVVHEGTFRIASAAEKQDVGMFVYADSPTNEISRCVFNGFSIQEPLPLEVLQFTDLSVSPPRITLGQPTTIRAKVTNTSTQSGPARVALYFDDHEPYTQWLDLAPSEVREVEFRVTGLDIKHALWQVEFNEAEYIFADHQVTIGTAEPATLTIAQTPYP